MTDAGEPRIRRKDRIKRRRHPHVTRSLEPCAPSMSDIVAQIERLHRQAVLEYTPLVEGIIRSDNRDVHQIERTLDGLLDFGSHDSILQLYRRLCRHYSRIDHAATASYIQSYRAMWDSD
jgi:hypothetical protein